MLQGATSKNEATELMLPPPRVLQVFHKPMSESGRLTEKEMVMVFANWRELIICNTKLLK